MKVNTSSLLSFLTFAWLNKSSKPHQRDAWMKFMWHGLSVLAFDLFIIWLIPYKEWFKTPETEDFLRATICSLLQVYFSCRLFLRYIMSWRGFFREIRFGFFECDRDRRLKRARDLSHEEIPNDFRVLCTACAPDEILSLKKLADEEKRRMIEQAKLKGLSGQILETLDVIFKDAQAKASERRSVPHVERVIKPTRSDVKSPKSVLFNKPGLNVPPVKAPGPFRPPTLY